MTDTSMTLGLVLGPVQFDRPAWLLLLPIVIVLTWWIGRKSLAGLGGSTKWIAFGLRCLLMLALVGAIAEPSRRRVAENVAVTALVDASRSVPPKIQSDIERYIAAARETKQPEDELGVITTAREALVQSLPSKRTEGLERQDIGDTNATNLAAAVRLGLAVTKQDAANRLLLVTDGNETAGSLFAAASAAQAVGIPIDILPVQFRHDSEVIVERIIAPATARSGETVNVNIVATSTGETTGEFFLTQNGQPVDLDPTSDGLGVRRTLDEGKNVLAVPVIVERPGAQEFSVTYIPDGPGDSIQENNRAETVTFVGSEGFLLIIAETALEAEPLRRVVEGAGLKADVLPSDRVPSSLAELNRYEALVLVNQSAGNFSELHQRSMREFVHDSGGGLVMVGGPESFGAGGWIGSTLEEVLPIRLDPPQKRQMPKGVLVMLMHSIEMPQGTFWGKQVATAAVDALSRLDLVGIIEHQNFGGTDWVHPISPVGDRAMVKRSINSLTFGDMQDFGPSLNLAISGLVAVEAGQKHCIVISDGDPQLNQADLTKFVAAGVSISTVGVFPHSPADFNTLQRMAQVTGGTFYPVNSQAALTTLPQIFIKEAQTIRRTLIWEGDPFQPAVANVGAESMRGITSVPPITGYVVAAEREGLSLVTLRGQENDPIAAQWQHGLGRVLTFTSDVSTRWASAWVEWNQFATFWEQQIRWAMRPGGSADIRVTTQDEGDRTRIIVEAFENDGDRLNFAEFVARAATPDGQGREIIIRQAGPGRYEGVLETPDPGSYVVNLRYRAAGDDEMIEGSVQAAVSRPFADEFVALEDNRALLEQVAEATGGRVLQWNPETDDLWSRAGLVMPVSTRPIWIQIAIAAVGILLLDVAVRRVRIEPRAIARTVFSAFQAKEAKAAGAQIDSLKQAREKARERFGSSDAPQEQTASRKFEAEPSATPTEPIVSAAPTDADLGAKPKQSAPKPKDAAGDEESGLSRLMQAKKRAQQEFNKDENDTP